MNTKNKLKSSYLFNFGWCGSFSLIFAYWLHTKNMIFLYLPALVYMVCFLFTVLMNCGGERINEIH